MTVRYYIKFFGLCNYITEYMNTCYTDSLSLLLVFTYRLCVVGQGLFMYNKFVMSGIISFPVRVHGVGGCMHIWLFVY